MYKCPRRTAFSVTSLARALAVLLPGTVSAVALPLPPAACAAIVATDTVTGKVLGSDGKPIKDAAVYVAKYEASGTFLAAGTRKTDADGVFRVEMEPAALPSGAAEKELGFKFYGIATITVPGMGTLQKALTSRANGNEFRLAPACTVSGTVVDENKKPVAGTKVVLRNWIPSPLPGGGGGGPLDTPFLMPLPGIPDSVLSTTTGPDGKWTMSGLPGTGKANFGVAGPDRVLVIRSNGEVALAEGKTVTLAPMETSPASAITGRVVDAAGKPAKGIQVYAAPEQTGTAGSAVTGADGAYRLEGLSLGAYTVSFIAPDETLAVAPLVGVTVAEGKPLAVKDVVLTAGAIIEGTVTDAETGKPIPGAVLTSQAPNSRSVSSQDVKNATTTADGRCRLVAAPGKVEVSLVGVPTGYQSPDEATQTFSLAAGERKTVGFALTRALAAEGVVVGTDGAPLSGIHVRVLGANDYDFSYSGQEIKATDAAGKWRVEGLSRTEKAFRIAVDPEWEVVSPKTFTLPNPALTITLKRQSVLALSGRVVTTTGEPLPGANVYVSAQVTGGSNGGRSQRSENLQTDARGSFTVKNLRPDETASVSVSLAGYKFRSGGAQTKTADGVTVSDVVMVRLSGQIKGQVVKAGPNGKVPVAGAYVWSLDGDDAAFATTDTAGSFTLSNLPEDTVQVSAAVRTSFGTGSAAATAAATAPLVISLGSTLAPALPLGIAARTRAILSEIAAEVKGKPNADRSIVVSRLAADDPDAAFALAAASHSDGIVPDGVLATIVEARAKVDAPRAMVWAAPRLAGMKYGLVRCRVEGELALSLAAVAPDQAARMYAAAIADGKDGNALTINRARLVAAAALLRNGEANAQMALLKEALAAPSAKNERVRCAFLVARGDTALADALVADSSIRERAEYYAEMTRRAVKTSPANAERYLNKLNALKLELKGDKYRSDPTAPETLNNLNWYLAEITMQVIDAIGPTNPDRTLRMARSYPKFEGTQDNRWLALGYAARAQSKADAPAVWNEAEALAGEQEWSRGVNLARLAALAASGPDPTVADALWKKAKAAMHSRFFRAGETETFALHAARFDPALARMVMERAVATYLKGSPGETPSTYQAMQALIAFSALAPDEALTRLAALPQYRDGGVNSEKITGQLAVLKLLSLSPKQRAATTIQDLLNSIWQE